MKKKPKIHENHNVIAHIITPWSPEKQFLDFEISLLHPEPYVKSATMIIRWDE